MKLEFKLADKRTWERAKKLGEVFQRELRERLRPALEEEAKALYQEVRIAARKTPNEPMTAVFKQSTRPLDMLPFSLQESNWRTQWRINKDGVTMRWGVPAGRPMPNTSVTSRYKSLSELLTALHGGPDLNNPKAGRRQKVNLRTHILFARVHARLEYRKGRSHKKKRAGSQLKALTGRAAQLDKQYRKAGAAEKFPLLKVGTILKRKPYPFLRDAYRARKKNISDTLKRVVKEALAAAVKGG